MFYYRERSVCPSTTLARAYISHKYFPEYYEKKYDRVFLIPANGISRDNVTDGEPRGRISLEVGPQQICDRLAEGTRICLGYLLGALSLSFADRMRTKERELVPAGG